MSHGLTPLKVLELSMEAQVGAGAGSAAHVVMASMEAAGFVIVPVKTDTMKDRDHERWLLALMDRLRLCKRGETYPLDLVERQLLLDAIEARPK